MGYPAGIDEVGAEIEVAAPLPAATTEPQAYGSRKRKLFADTSDSQESAKPLPRRRFGKTGWMVSEVSFGSWAIGGDWGTTQGSTSSAQEQAAAHDKEQAMAALRQFLDLGGNLIDTADVYGGGRSEELIREVLSERDANAGPVYVITKAGRAPSPHGPQNYTYENLKERVLASQKRLGRAKLDLLQLHCPPTSVLESGEVFGHLRRLVKEDLISYW